VVILVGKTLSHYEIRDSLGAGGMGEVYRARDTKLDRDVAIKVLPDDLAADPDRLARFEREAKLLAALSHANIGSIYGLEEADGVRFLVLELIEGETLEQRLRKGAIPVPEALDIARQIAEALEAAHDEGIIHRDVKPANVLLTPKGGVKVLDFGIAKSTVLDTGVAETELATSLTMDGTLMGTPPYMSPEQVRGAVVDKRADIWAFGCVVYEMLTGRSAFGAETLADTLAAIVDREPDLAALPASTPSLIRSLVRRCLRKDPLQRLHDIADARIEIDEALSEPRKGTPEGTVSGERIAGGRRVPFWGLATVFAVAVATGIGVWALMRPAPEPAMSVTVPFPQGTANFAVSPDERYLADMGRQNSGPRLHVRPLQSIDEDAASPIQGTEDALNLSWTFSPGGESIAFVTSAGRLWRVSLAGGPPSPLGEVDVTNLRGMTWTRDGDIIFAAMAAGIWSMPEDGGPARLVATPPPGAQYAWPEVAPDGKTLLVTVRYGLEEQRNRRLGLVDLESGKLKDLDVEGTYPRFAQAGRVVFARFEGSIGSDTRADGSLFAVSYDPDLREMGSPVLLRANIAVYPHGKALFELSDDSLFFVAGRRDEVDRSLLWVDRQGGETPVSLTSAPYRTPRLSPDETKIVYRLQGVDYGDALYIHDIASDSRTVLTTDSRGYTPQWSLDGVHIYFNSITVERRRADLTGDRQQVVPNPGGGRPAVVPNSLSPDGELLYSRRANGTFGIFAIRPEGDRTPRTILDTAANETTAKFSPDGKWFAYAAVAAGTGDDVRREVWVREYPDGPPLKVSIDGGQSPMWSKDGRELFYQSADGMMMAAAIQTEPVLDRGLPQPLFKMSGALPFEWQYTPGPRAVNYDVRADGTFLMLKEGLPDWPPPMINVWLDWGEELKQRVPTGR